MAAFMLESLVLRGVAVRQDVLAVELRLGASVKAGQEAPGNRTSKRHPSLGGFDPDVNYFTSATPGTGRSRCRPGQPACITPGHALVWSRPVAAALQPGTQDS